VPRNRGKNTTLIASLSLAGMGAAMILEGSANATAFEIYIEQLLVPSLQAGQIVVMDNLRAHKGERVRQAIEAKGCQVLFPAWAIRPTCPPLKRPSPSSKRPCDGRELEREKRLKKPSARPCSR
jgi:transposase